jgi:hypothetical protein
MTKEEKDATSFTYKKSDKESDVKRFSKANIMLRISDSGI